MTQPITPNDLTDKSTALHPHVYSKQKQQSMQNRHLVYTAANNFQAPSTFGSSAANLSRQQKGNKKHRRLFSAQVGVNSQSLHKKKVSDVIRTSEKRTAAASTSGKSMPHDQRMSKLAN